MLLGWGEPCRRSSTLTVTNLHWYIDLQIQTKGILATTTAIFLRLFNQTGWSRKARWGDTRVECSPQQWEDHNLQEGEIWIKRVQWFLVSYLLKILCRDWPHPSAVWDNLCAVAVCCTLLISTSSTMTTVVRLPEFVPPKSFTVDINSNYEDEINHQLSSPLSSYLQVPMQDTTGNNSRVHVVLRHPQYYPERLEVTA